MSEIELKVIFNDEINPIQNIIEFNNQIIEFLRSIVDYKNNETKGGMTELFSDPQKVLYQMGLIMMCSRLLKWYATMNLAFASGDQDSVQELDTLLKEFAQKIIQKEEIKNNAN
jgi:hypothetical protein